jgi:hypothetical protein
MKIINVDSLIWLITEHRCPECHKAVVDFTEYQFMQSSGMCGSCDHILADGMSDARLEHLASQEVVDRYFGTHFDMEVSNA